MPAKGVVDRQRVAEGLIASARTHAQEVGERLQTNLGATVRLTPPKRRAAESSRRTEG